MFESHCDVHLTKLKRAHYIGMILVNFMLALMYYLYHTFLEACHFRAVPMIIDLFVAMVWRRVL